MLLAAHGNKVVFLSTAAAAFSVLMPAMWDDIVLAIASPLAGW